MGNREFDMSIMGSLTSQVSQVVEDLRRSASQPRESNASAAALKNSSQLVRVDIIHILVIIEMLLVGDSFTALSCCDSGTKDGREFWRREIVLTIVSQAGVEDDGDGIRGGVPGAKSSHEFGMGRKRLGPPSRCPLFVAVIPLSEYSSLPFAPSVVSNGW